jgi:murein DD-endopeptidase MepM/ murein hydrolase activator NlpD
LTNAGGTGGTYYPPPTDEQLAELTTGAGGGNVAGETPPNYDEQMAAEAAPPPAQAAPPQGGLGAVETTIAGEAPPPNTVTPSETGEGQTTPGGGAAPGPMQQTQSIVSAPIVATPDPAGGSSEIGEGPPPTELVDAVCQGCGGQIIGDFKDPTTNPDYCSYATPETGFGDCTNHPGIDIGCAECFGQDVTTPVGGKVICGQTGDAPSVEYNSCAAFCQYADATLNPSGECGAGRIEVLRDGTDNQTIIYGHMNTSNVKAGDTIAPGTVLGAMGIARSPHTHMEARIICDGGGYQIVDPALVLSGHYDGYRC